MLDVVKRLCSVVEPDLTACVDVAISRIGNSKFQCIKDIWCVLHSTHDEHMNIVRVVCHYSTRGCRHKQSSLGGEVCLTRACATTKFGSKENSFDSNFQGWLRA